MKESVGPVEDANGDLIPDDWKIIEILNQYFLTVYMCSYIVINYKYTRTKNGIALYNASSNQMLEEVNLSMQEVKKISCKLCKFREITR